VKIKAGPTRAGLCWRRSPAQEPAARVAA
jgi:hypothetical protein